MPSTGHLSRSLHKSLRARYATNMHRYVTGLSAPTFNRQDKIPQSLWYDKPPSETNWYTPKTQEFSKRSLGNLLDNRVPDISARRFLSANECASLVKILKTHQIGSYNENVYPPIGSVGITQFDNQQDKGGYFAGVKCATQLQDRFRNEAGIDVIERVRELLARTSGLPVRIAQEGDREYFAGLVRLINKSAKLHADFGQYDGPDWEIGSVASQITWNILLKDVQGGESVVYDRFWEGANDDARYKEAPPGYGYSRQAVEGRAFKAMKYGEGDLHFFNSRNFHEVRALPSTAEESRYTISSFVGLLPATASSGPALIMWS